MQNIFRSEHIAKTAATFFCIGLSAVLIAGCAAGTGTSSDTGNRSESVMSSVDSSGLQSSDENSDQDSAVSQNDSVASSEPAIDVIREKDLMIGSIGLNMTQDEFLQIMTGEPIEKRVEKDEFLDFTETTYIYEGLEVLFVDDACYSVIATGSGYATPRGLAVGDSQDKVLLLYGEPSSRSDGRWGYNYEGGADYEVFSLTIVDGKVAEIKIILAL